MTQIVAVRFFLHAYSYDKSCSCFILEIEGGAMYAVVFIKTEIHSIGLFYRLAAFKKLAY